MRLIRVKNEKGGQHGSKTKKEVKKYIMKP